MKDTHARLQISCSILSIRLQCCTPEHLMHNIARMYLINPLEFFTSCESTPCMNGGICRETDGKHRCNCPEPFHGPFCQFTSKDWNYSWTATEFALLFVVVFLIACAVGIICCSFGNSMGFYVSVPTKRYSRWNEEDISDDEDDLIALGVLQKGTLRMSRTAETIIETESPCGSSQQVDTVDL